MIIQLIGASGSGKSTLAGAVGRLAHLPVLHSDHYLWQDSDFTIMRPIDQQHAMLQADLARHSSFVLDGGVHRWLPEGALRPTLLVLLRLDQDTRMERLRQREWLRYGARCLPGSDHYALTEEFLEWAATYETALAHEEHTSLAGHFQLLRQAPCPCLILWNTRPAEELAQLIFRTAQQLESAAPA